jgi:hypothetical protein
MAALTVTSALPALEGVLPLDPPDPAVAPLEAAGPDGFAVVGGELVALLLDELPHAARPMVAAAARATGHSSTRWRVVCTGVVIVFS